MIVLFASLYSLFQGTGGYCIPSICWHSAELLGNWHLKKVFEVFEQTVLSKNHKIQVAVIRRRTALWRAASPRLRPLQLLLAACVRFSCCSRARLRHCCSPFASASSCCSPIAPASASAPDRVRFDCCSPIAFASTAARPIASASAAAPRLHTGFQPMSGARARTFFAEFEVQ